MPAEASSIRDPSAHYASHHAALQARYEGLLDDLPWDSVVIWSGSPRLVFRDDRHYPFRAGPFYQQWVPARDHAESALLLRPGRRPRLVLNLPEDYWHSVPEPPRAAWVDTFELERAADLESVRALLPDNLSRTALIGDALGAPTAWGFGAINPAELVTALEFARLYKTPYEVACIAAANRLGARGHVAAREAFEAGESELGIHLAYLAATCLTEAELPYDNIVALNEHGATLHHGKLDRAPPGIRRSFLIDAGAEHAGYASDITRTWAADPEGPFSELVAALDDAQQRIVAGISPGKSFVALHEAAELAVAEVLVGLGILDMDAEAAVREGVSNVFLPHGLGHHLGLQVHDSGGKLADAGGARLPQPEAWPFLRNLRPVEAGNVFTIEPGIYFIDPLLRGLKQSPLGRHVDWDAVDGLRPFGGARIEDNVWVGPAGTRNLTREAFVRPDAA